MLSANRGRYTMEQKERNALALAREQNVLAQLKSINERSARFGLRLSEGAMLELSLRREQALVEHGRVELGASVLPALIDGFCDSPYLLQEEFAETVGRLTEAFYEYKNEDGDRMTDDELITCLRVCYDAYEGTLDAALSLSIEDLRRKRRLDGPDDPPGGEEAAEDA